MDLLLQIPNASIVLALVQGTKIHKYYRFLHFLPLPCWWLISFEVAIRSREIRRILTKQLIREYECLKEFFSKKVSEIVDVGCGVGAIGLLVWDHYDRRKKIDFYRIDKNEVGENRIYLLPAADDFRLNIENAELVISLYSWGFHYPVSTYLEAVFKTLKMGGRLILDVRSGSDGVKAIKRRFGNVKVIEKTSYSYRILAVK